MARSLKIFIVVALSIVLYSCSKSSNPGAGIVTPPDTTASKDTIPLGRYGAILPDTSQFHQGVQTGTLNDPLILGASGLGASRAYPNMFWTHNDARKYNYIFLLDSTATRKAFFQVTGGSNIDWTDMAIGPGPVAGTNYIYLADVGDSKVNRSNVDIQRFPEPHGPLDTSGALGETDKADIISFQYPDGARDAETILLDPLTKDIYIIDKGDLASVYVAHYPQPVDSMFTIKKIALLQLTSLRGGSMSSDGQEILVKDLYHVYYWKRKPNESVLGALLRPPVTVPYTTEIHGEAICWSLSGDSYWTTTKVDVPGNKDFTVYRRK